MAQTGKYPPAMWETWVQFLHREDPLEKGMATHSRTLAWRIPWTEELAELQFMGLQRAGHDRATKHSTCKQPKSSWSLEGRVGGHE